MNQLPERLERWFNLRESQLIGVATLLTIIFLVVTPYMFTSEHKLPEEPLASIDARALKFDKPEFHAFLNTVKRQDQAIFLGTSESGTLSGHNYYHYLNADTTLQKQFAFFAGAGRRVDAYIPLLLNHPDVWQGQELIVFLNPTYIRKGLNEPIEKYQKRYLSESVIRMSSLNPLSASVDYNWYGYSDIDLLPILVYVERLVFNQLQQLRAWVKPTELFKASSIKPKDFSEFHAEEFLVGVDTAYNISLEYKAKKKELNFPVADTSSRYNLETVASFISICQGLEIDLTLIIGPYNGFLVEAIGHTEKQSPYEQYYKDLSELALEREVNVIDLWDLSFYNNTFNDYQHHSEYGGYLIYQRIKAHYEKGN